MTSPKSGQRLSGQAEMMQMPLAALERLPAAEKITLGDTYLKNPKKLSTWLSLGRLGSRSPIYGGEHSVVGPEIASRWLEHKASWSSDWKKTEGAAFAATLQGVTPSSRMTGDAARDLDTKLRETVAERLQEAWVAGEELARAGRRHLPVGCAN